MSHGLRGKANVCVWNGTKPPKVDHLLRVGCENKGVANDPCTTLITSSTHKATDGDGNSPELSLSL